MLLDHSISRSLRFMSCLALAVVASAAIGCGDDDRGTPDGGGAGDAAVDAGPFEPLGMDAGIKLNWTLNGNPANATTCTELDIRWVEMVFLHDGEEIADPLFRFNCIQNGFEDVEPTLKTGVYQIVWRGLAEDESEVGRSLPISMDLTAVAPGTNYDLGVVDIQTDVGWSPFGADASLSYSWQIDSMAPSSKLCAAVNGGVGITAVRIMLYEADDMMLARGIEASRTPCEAGMYDSRPTNVLAAGEYIVVMQGVMGPVPQGSTEPALLTVAAGEHVEFPPVVFATAAP